jgi:murein DD-endopeptidase MepM/ murein hydrolase activator NlpD
VTPLTAPVAVARVGRPARLLVALACTLALAACGYSHPAARARAAPLPSATLPSPTPSASPAASPSPVPVRSPRRPAVAPPRRAGYVFPVTPAGQVRFGHTHHDYPATDIFAPCGDTFRAPTSGRVAGTSRVDTWSASVNAGATRGGLSVTLAGDDGVRYYGSHLRVVLPGVVPGARVAAGQVLGQVGNTGDARGIACHVHFGISPPCGSTDWFNRRGLVYPWPYLESWRAGGQLSPAAAVAAFRSRHGCPAGPTVDP